MGHFCSWEGLCCFSVLLSREAAACITAVGLQSHSSVSKGTFPKCLHLALLPRGHFLLSRTKRRDRFLSWCPLLFPDSQELVWMSRFVPGCLLLQLICEFSYSTMPCATLFHATVLHVPSGPCVPSLGVLPWHMCAQVSVENVGAVLMGLKGPDLPSTVPMPCA